jgi:hypothetical protein
MMWKMACSSARCQWFDEKKLLMKTSFRPFALICLSSLALVSAPERGAGAEVAVIPEDLVEDLDFREEMGVNEFTAPSIQRIFLDMDKLEPIPHEAARHDLPKPRGGNRQLLGLNFGGVIADGLLAAQTQDQVQLEAVGRLLVAYAESMGVGERAKAHGKSLLEKSYRSDWKGLKEELAAAQRDVEYDMLRLRDEEIAHMVSLGGWMRALEIGCVAVEADFTPEKAGSLVRTDLLDYFLDRLSMLEPKLKASPFFRSLTSRLQEIKNILAAAPGGKPDMETVKKIHAVATELNNMVVTPGS